MDEEVQIVPFKAEHLKGQVIRGTGVSFNGFLTSDEHLAILEKCGPGYTCLIGKKILGSLILGLFPYPGVAQAMMLLTPLADKHKAMMHRIVKRCIQDVQSQNKWKRLECCVDSASGRDRKWVERLGFVNEGTMRGRGFDNSDMEMYARFLSDHSEY